MGMISPASTIKNAYTEAVDEESKYYVLTRFVFIPLILGSALSIMIDADKELFRFLATILSILGGFSISAIFSLTSSTKNSGGDFESFFRSLRYYTTYSIFLILFILPIAFLVSEINIFYLLEILLFSAVSQYVLILFVIVRRVETVVKKINF